MEIVEKCSQQCSHTCFHALFEDMYVGWPWCGWFWSPVGERVVEFGLENNTWINDLYERKITLGYIFCRYKDDIPLWIIPKSHFKICSLKDQSYEFCSQFHKCISYFCHWELIVFFFTYGDEVLESNIHCIERSADKKYTKKMFKMFIQVLKKCSYYKVVDCHETTMCLMQLVVKYRCVERKWSVSYCPSVVGSKCSCLWMESIGLPCFHIVLVLILLDFYEILDSLILHN